MSIQARIDEKAYPPTHQYDFSSLTPKDVLKERIEIIDRICPEFFPEAKFFLDIGCSKGFFSMRAAQWGANVLGLDTDAEAVAISQDVARAKNLPALFIKKAFRSLEISAEPEDRFDRVFIGNVHHYLFVDAGGWNFIYKLAALAAPGALILVEGPTGMECQDMGRVIPFELQSLFNRDVFLSVMGRFFEPLKIVPSPSYTPDRYIMSFRRRESVLDLDVEDTASHVPVKPEEIIHQNSRNGSSVSRFGNLVAKVYDKPEWCEVPLYPSVALANEAPFSWPVVGGIYNGFKTQTRDGTTHIQNRFAGWLERYFDVPPFSYYEQESACFYAHCVRNIFFSSNGYLDPDAGTINFTLINNELVHFDKNSVVAIAGITHERIRRLDIEIRQSYKNPKILQRFACIVRALRSGDSHKIEDAYRAASSTGVES